MCSINKSYKEFVKRIIQNGHWTFKDGKEILENLGNIIRIDNPLGYSHKAKYELITSGELIYDIEKGEFDIDGCPINGQSLSYYVKSFNSSDVGGFKYTYPNRIKAYFRVNQFETMVERLIDDLGSNRSVAVTLDPKHDCSEEDIPCLQVLQAIVRDRKLTIHCFFRSNDIFGAYYSNMYFITYIGMLLVEELNRRDPVNANIVFDGIYYYSSSAHIYKTDYNKAKKLVGL